MEIANLVSAFRLDLLFFLLPLLILFHVYVTWNYSHWKKLGVPYVEPTFFFGNITDSIVGRKSIGVVYQDIYWKLSGHPYGGFFKFRQPAILIRDPELIKLVLVKEFQSFHDNDFQVSEKTDPMLGRNPFVLTGERWRIVRGQLTPALTAGKVRSLFPLMLEVCKEVVEYLEKEPAARSSVGLDAKELSAQFTTDVVASTVFGLRGNSFKDPDADFRRMGRSILRPDFWKSLQHNIIIFAPRVADIFNFKFIGDEVADFFRRVVRDVTSYRDEHKIKRSDFMQLMMQMRSGHLEDDNGVRTDYSKYSLEDMAAHGTMFFTDGFETSSTVLGFTLFELALNEDLQQQLREEIAEVSGGQITYENLQEMPLLDKVMSESMRKYPPVMFMTRLCTKPFSLPMKNGGSCKVDVGTSIVIPVYALHRDPEYYPDPELFDPDRFSEEAQSCREKYTYLPFGEGPRICLGTRFALAQTKAGIASIVSNYDIRTCSKTVSPVTPDPHYLLFAAKEGLHINFFRRNGK